MNELQSRVENAIRWILIAIAAVTPLMMSFWHYDAFDLPKITFIYIAALLLVMLTSIDFLIFRKQFSWIRTPLDFPILAFLLATTLSVFLSTSPIASLVGEYGRYETLPALYAFALIYQLSVQYLRSKEWINKLLFAMFGSLTISTIYGLAQGAGLDILPDFMKRIELRSRSTMGNAIFYGAYLTILIPLVFSLLLDKKKRFVKNSSMQIWLGCLGILAFANIIMTESRGPWLGLIFGLIALAFLNSKEIKAHAKEISSMIIIAVVLIILVFSIGTGGHPLSKFAEISGRLTNIADPSGSASARLEIWKSSYKMFINNPVFGYGVDQSQFNLLRFKTLKHAIQEGFLIADRAHNEYFQILLDSGIVGGLAFIWILVAAFLAWRKRSLDNSFYLNGLGAAFISYLVQAITGITVIGCLAVLTVLAGITAALVNPNAKESTFRAPGGLYFRSSIVIVFALLTIIAGYFSQIPLQADRHMYSAMKKSQSGSYGREVLVDEIKMATLAWPYQGYYEIVLGRWLIDLAIDSQSSELLEEAIKTSLDSLVYNPDESAFYLIAGRASLTLGRVLDDDSRLREGEAYLRMKLKMDPLDPQARESLLHYYMGNQRFKQALEQVRLLRYFYPKKVEYLESMALAYESLGDNKNASKAYREIKHLNPSYPNIDANIERTSRSEKTLDE